MKKIVSSSDAGKSLRQLLKSWTDFSSRQVKDEVHRGRVLVNSRKESFGSAILKKDDQVEWAESATPEKFKIESSRFIHLDENLLVYNKAPAYPCQRTRDPSRWNLEDAIAAYALEKKWKKPVLAHRLDRDTSGVILFGREKTSAGILMNAFKERSVQKTYWALTYGEYVDDTQGSWLIYLKKRTPKKGQSFMEQVHSGGLRAETTFRVLQKGKGFTYWELKPKTGRTHQLRVSLASVGHPIVGDLLYDPKHRSRSPIAHHLLHAGKLELPIFGQEHTFEAPLPLEFKKFLLKLNFKN